MCILDADTRRVQGRRDALPVDYVFSPEEEAEWETLFDQRFDTAGKIAAAVATTVHGLIIKARVAKAMMPDCCDMNARGNLEDTFADTLIRDVISVFGGAQ